MYLYTCSFRFKRKTQQQMVSNLSLFSHFFTKILQSKDYALSLLTEPKNSGDQRVENNCVCTYKLTCVNVGMNIHLYKYANIGGSKYSRVNVQIHMSAHMNMSVVGKVNS